MNSNAATPSSDSETGTTATATFGMGCFWTPDAYYGHLPGVLRTRVGYAGGTTAAPVYRDMGDHTETVQVDYDPALIGYDQLLEAFWERHNPDNLLDYKGNQYRSLILYHTEQQRMAIEAQRQRIGEQGRSVAATAVLPCTSWHPAEERHQKYYLKRYPDAYRRALELYGSETALTDGSLAARLNGIAKGFASAERLRDELASWPISVEERERYETLVRSIKW
ncbi:peptide-methionine (S)-S-oxide reductase [Paenibacillus sp. 598K]|uniref:peptide-methionine (S)-S-oxide reductase MsrA n=1 Tax=Paenibacillus sp. 598K TaxID=1117987 RepID=UPI000FFAB564|nr:peptide-methionine (S)-S-oxide reductase MsrA [Paenibacillus sp. 598K]GBF77998.1 peptide-methionine (S)-S-oxide reductase [Paenibacillus sp. 598K]